MNVDYTKLVAIRRGLKENKDQADSVAKKLRNIINPEVPLVLCSTLSGVLIQIENMISVLPES